MYLSIDILNFIAAGIAIFISWRLRNKFLKLSQFDTEYGDRIINGCNTIRNFTDQISAVASELDAKKRKSGCDELASQLISNTNPLLNAATYFDENYSVKSEKEDLSSYAVEIIENLSSILIILSERGLESENWMPRYKSKLKSVNNTLSNIHSYVLKQKKSL